VFRDDDALFFANKSPLPPRKQCAKQEKLPLKGRLAAFDWYLVLYYPVRSIVHLATYKSNTLKKQIMNPKNYFYARSVDQLWRIKHCDMQKCDPQMHLSNQTNGHHCQTRKWHKDSVIEVQDKE
jgi:hypothetical protein